MMKTENSIRAFPLSIAGEEEWVRVVGINGGKNLLKRLITIGLIVGTEIQVLQREKQAGLVVRCGETRVALGIGMAHKIIVEPVFTQKF